MSRTMFFLTIIGAKIRVRTPCPSKTPNNSILAVHCRCCEISILPARRRTEKTRKKAVAEEGGEFDGRGPYKLAVVFE